MLLTAHAGCDQTAPNSQEYLNYAFASQADVVEVDVRMGSGELVLSHDVPSAEPVGFSNALDLLAEHPEKRLNCDLKTEGLEQAVYQAALRYGVQKRLIFTGEVEKSCFDSHLLDGVAWYANLNAFAPGLEKTLDHMPPQEAKKALLCALDATKGSRAAGINWYYRHALIVWEDAKERGVGISVWTVDEPEDLKRILALQPDNVTTNRVALAAGWIKKKGSE